jgi:hypothetical protein
LGDPKSRRVQTKCVRWVFDYFFGCNTQWFRVFETNSESRNHRFWVFENFFRTEEPLGPGIWKEPGAPPPPPKKKKKKKILRFKEPWGTSGHFKEFPKGGPVKEPTKDPGSFLGRYLTLEKQMENCSYT